MKKVIFIICGVLLILGVLGLSFYAGTRYANLEQNNSSTLDRDKNALPDEETPELVKLDDPLVVDATKFLPNLMCHGYALKLNEKDRVLKDLTDEEKLSIVAAYFAYDLSLDEVDDGEDYTGEVHKEVKESDVKKLFEDTSFLKSLTKNKNDNRLGLDYRGFYYDFKDKKYYANIIATGCIDEEYEDDYLQLFSAKKTSKTLVLDYSYAYLSTKYDEKKDNFTNALYRKEGDKEPLVKDVEADEYGFDVDWASFDHYEFVFDISDGNLRLHNINFVEAK